MNETVNIKVEIHDSDTENTIQEELDLFIVKHLKEQKDENCKNDTILYNNQDDFFEPNTGNIGAEESKKFLADNNNIIFVGIKQEIGFDSPEENTNIDPMMDVVSVKVEKAEHKPSTRIKKWLYCAQCSYKVQYPSDLTRHITSRHSEERPVKCTKCHFTTKRSNALEQHMVNKHTPEDFEWIHCDHCSYKAKRRVDLKRHLMTVHSSSKDFKCDFCEAAFNRIQNLKRHMLQKHTSDKLFKWYDCDQCPKKYKENGSLKKHIMRVHQ